MVSEGTYVALLFKKTGMEMCVLISLGFIIDTYTLISVIVFDYQQSKHTQLKIASIYLLYTHNINEHNLIKEKHTQNFILVFIHGFSGFVHVCVCVIYLQCCKDTLVYRTPYHVKPKKNE